jgi:hypothetical protein
MTKEEIRQAAQDWDGSEICTASEEGAFIAGAEWMQAQVEEWLRKSGRGQMMGSLNRFLDSKVDVSK